MRYSACIVVMGTTIKCCSDLFYGRPDLQPLICSQMGNQIYTTFGCLEIPGALALWFCMA